MATEQEKTKPGNDPLEYYDILLVGRTGLGKSTTGNKLLGIVYEPLVKIHEAEEVITAWGKDGVNYFVTGDTSESVTAECKLLSKENGIRVLDTPGFANDRLAKKFGPLECNQQIFRWILEEQEKHDLAFRRVLYFLPNRGPLERAEGTLQEEIRVMYDFLGEDIFNIMVIIATNQKDEKYQIDFDEEDISTTERVFTTAFEEVTGQLPPKCPPILYLSFAETDVLKKSKSAEVIVDRPMRREPIVIDFMPTEDFDTFIRNAKQSHPGRRLHLRDRCSRCACTLIYKESLTGNWEVKVVTENGEVACKESKCHPLFIPKHDCLIRIVLWICGKLCCNVGSDKICPICNLPPGSEGCLDVGTQVAKRGQNIRFQTSHSTRLDSVL